MKLRNNKKGFTIVELVIVIAVIGILTAILVPVFINLTNKANEASDQSLVKNLNTALKMVENDPSAEDEDTHQKLSGKNNTMQDVVLDLKYEGYYLENLVAKSGQDLLWDASKNEFFLSTESTQANVDYWQIVNEVPATASQKYSYYAGKNFNTTVPNLKYGFDAGYNEDIASLKYVGPGATTGQTASIRTNGGALEIDAQYDRVHHYGKADSVDIKAVKGDSYREFGEAGFAKIANGRLVVEESAKIDGIYLVATGAEFNNIKIAVVGEAKLPDVARAEVTLGTDESKLVVEVQSLATSQTEPSTENTQFVWISNNGSSVESKVTSSKTDATAVVDNPLPAAAAAQQDTEQSAAPISDDSVARINAVGYDSLQAAFGAAKTGNTVYLLKDIDCGTSVVSLAGRYFALGINKGIIFDGGNNTIASSASSARAILGISGNDIDVEIRNVTLNGASVTRGIETRGSNIKTLKLDNVTINSGDSTVKDAAALQIGGSQDTKLKLNIDNCTLNDSKYGILTYNSVDATISNTSIKGWSCFNLKGVSYSYGSLDSTFLIKNSVLDSSNPHSGTSNAFGMIVFEDNNIVVNLEDTEIKVANLGDQYQAIGVNNVEHFTDRASDNSSSVYLGKGVHIIFTGNGAIFSANEAPVQTVEGYILTTSDQKNYYVVAE